MSVPSKSIEKNKRYAGVKTNDFVNKNRPTERTRTAAPSQGWANLGKVNARRIPPPANLPSLKSETGGSSTAFDSIVPPGSSTHGWTATNHQSAPATNSGSVPRPLTPSKQPTQQQLDSISAHAPAFPNDNDKTRAAANSWNHGTTTPNHSESNAPNLLGLNDFPRLVTQETSNAKQTKAPQEAAAHLPPSQGPSLRPANLSSWKDGGGRVPPVATESTEPTIAPLLPPSTSNVPPPSSSSSYNRMYSPQSPMWTQNSSRPKSNATNHSYGHSHRSNDYKTPTILRHKDIDDLSKLNDNVTWASASQEVNYEEKIRFSDDEDHLETTETIKKRRPTAQARSRYLHDEDQHFKQMQEDKNSELISTLTVAKQRRDEQERHIRPKASEGEQKSAYSSQRPLPSDSSSMWNSNTSRPRHDTNDSQQFTMKSWSDQMDSFNYASLHEKAAANNVEPDETNTRKTRRSPSESSTQSPIESVEPPKAQFPVSKTLQARKTTILPSKAKRNEPTDYFEPDAEPFNDWEETSVEPKETTKTRTNFSRSADISTGKPVPPPIASSTKTSQSVWRHLSPTRAAEPTSHDSITVKSSQQKPVETSNTSYNDRRQPERKSRYTALINTASIPPLMSVRSDLPPPPPPATTGTTSTSTKQFKSTNYSRTHDFYAENNDDEYYDDETGYYDSNVSSHSRHHPSVGYQSHSHHRGYTTLGSYGRYRRGGSLRHQQQYPTYPASSSAPLNTSGGSKPKKPVSSQTTKDLPLETDEPVKKPAAWAAAVVEEIPIIKTAEPLPTPIPTINETEPIKEIPVEAPKPLLSTEIEAPALVDANASTTKKVSQKKTYPNQTAPRHRNTYGRSMNEYESMPMTAHNYYGSSRRDGGGRMQDLSSVYYYNQSQSRYHNQYNNYPTEHYPSARPNPKTSKRGGATKTTSRDQPTTKQSSPAAANSTHQRQHSASDNEQKEGEEWETASESSTNMRNGHQETHAPAVKPTATEVKANPHDRTPPKKSFSSQRPVNTRHTDRRGHAAFERGNKTSRSLTSHRPARTTNKSTSEETKATNPPKKDLHRHSLDGYDLNNVAGVVKIETLPAGALEEEGDAFDDGGEEFCLVMSKRDRKEQKAAQLSKQNALDSADTSTKTTPLPSTSNDPDEPTINEKSTNENATQRSRGGKSLPPRFNSKSGNSRQQSANKGDNNMYYYDQNSYYYYNQNQYYDQEAYYNYGNYGSTQRNPSTRRKQQRPNQTAAESNVNEEHLTERKHETNLLEKPNVQPTNVMSNIDMWDPQTENPVKTSKKLIEKPATHERKYPNEIVSTSAVNENSLPLHQRTSNELPIHSPIAKSNETIARAIKPPAAENKSDREAKSKSTNYEKNDTISTLAPNQLFPKNTFLDYDDKQSIGTVGDDYNQKINSLKTIWDASDHPSEQLEQTINTMVAMKQQQQHQQQDSNAPPASSTKTDSYGKEAITVSSANISGPAASISSGSTDEGTKKALASTGSSNNMNPGTNYSANSAPNKNEQKSICAVKPTQQVPPNIQDQVDVTAYPTFAVPQIPAPMSQASLQQQQQQQHLLSQAQVNSLHQAHSYSFYDSHLPLPPQQSNQQQQPPPPFNRMYSSNTSTNSSDLMSSDFSNSQSSPIYPPQNFPYRNTNMYMQGPPSVPNTNSMYHHTSQGSISAPPQNNAMPPPMPNYPSPFLMDHGGHMIGQPQPPPPPQGPPQAYMNNQLMSSRPQAGPYYRTAPQQQLQTPPGPPYAAQEAMAHGGFYPTFYQAPNSNAPPVGHPSAHNMYGQNEGFHPPHPAMFARGGSMDRADHPLMSQPLSRPTNFPSASSTQAPGGAGAAAGAQQQQQGPPPSGPPPSLLSQNLKGFPPTQQGNSSVNQASFYPPPAQGNQYARQPMPIGAMNTANNRQQTQQVPSLMSGLAKTFPTNGNSMNTNQSLFQHRQPLMPPQANNNRSLYQHQSHYSSYQKSSPAPNDETIKPKHI